MDILTIIQKFLISIVMCGVFFLGGIHFGRIEGRDRLLDQQVVSADYIVDRFTRDYSCYEKLDDFTFDICKQLGLIKPKRKEREDGKGNK